MKINLVGIPSSELLKHRGRVPAGDGDLARVPQLGDALVVPDHPAARHGAMFVEVGNNICKCTFKICIWG